MPGSTGSLRALGIVAVLAPFAGCLGPFAPSASDSGSQPGEGAAPPAAASPLALRDWDPETPPPIHHDPPFPLEDGQRPTEDEAQEFAAGYSTFHAEGNGGLDQLRAEGHLRGNGTPANPYVLDQFYIDGSLTIESTNRSLILRNGYVEGTLRLNYAGPSVYVHHVYARDLRINENVERHGPNTGGLWHDNAFAIVGQIRHFVGEFRNNEVGPAPEGPIEQVIGDSGVFPLGEDIVFNFDGFHTADVHHNTFLGRVDVKLHGHNHADCFLCPVHDHANEEEFPGRHAHETQDGVLQDLGFRTRHSIRYVSLLFRDNEIHVEEAGWALRYNDRNHAGDDRTANSEPNEYLNDAHLHVQDVTFARNRLVGGGFLLDVFNAEDDHHPLAQHGILRLLENDVTVQLDESAWPFDSARVVAMDLGDASGVELRARGNVVRFQTAGPVVPVPPVPLQQEFNLVGIQLDGFEFGNLTIAQNVVEQGTFGLYAHGLADSIQWKLLGNDYRTLHVWQGSDVSNPPQEGTDG